MHRGYPNMVTYLITLAGRGHHPLNMHLEVWCAKIEPKLKKKNPSKNPSFSDVFSSFFRFFEILSILTEFYRTKPPNLTLMIDFASFDTSGVPRAPK